MSNPLDGNGVVAEPCPFCGCADIIASNVGEDEDNWFVGCMEAKCGVNPGVFCPDSEADAIALWNRRAPPAPSQTAVEPVALAQALKNLTEGAEQEDREILYAAASTLTAQAAALVAAERERDEALDRVEELEAEAGVVSDEFEKECWRAMKSLLKQCEFDWSWVDSDGISADDAREHISETINGIEGDRKAAVARAEAAETEVATLKGRVAELEAGLELPYEFDRYINGVLMAEGVTIEAVADFAKAMLRAARIASRGPNGEVPVLVLRARRLTPEEKSNGR